jgi:hypothetical protein
VIVEAEGCDVTVVYRHEGLSWWAESRQVPSLFAGDQSLAGAQARVREVLGNNRSILHVVEPREAGK